MDFRSVILGDEMLAVVEGPFNDRIARRASADFTKARAAGVKRIVIDLCECPRVDEVAVAALAATAVPLVDEGGVLYLALDADVFIEIDDEAVVRTVFER